MKMTGTKQQHFGKLLCLSLGLLLSCRSSLPPPKEICIGDGIGGADCIEADGSKLYRSPSKLENYWMTNSIDMQNFSSWCYDTSATQISTSMNQIQAEARE